MTSSKSVTTSLVPSIDRIVIVGASLAGLRAAEALRDEGYTGHITLIGDEPFKPYDRPPLSKTVLTGWLPIDRGCEDEGSACTDWSTAFIAKG